jgi:8-oxo-dGTP pyrophosphatase MutT (NUDIX family)
MKEEIKLYPDPKLKFIKEGETYYGLIQDEVYNNKVHEELLYCEIEKTQGGWQCIWEDNHIEKHKFQDLQDAQTYAMLEYQKRTPFSNGKNWDLEDED